ERVVGGLLTLGSGLLAPLPQRQLRLDDLEGQEVVALLGEDEADPLQVLFVELSIPALGAGGRNETLGLEEAQLRNRDVWKLVPQQLDDFANAQRLLRHCRELRGNGIARRVLRPLPSVPPSRPGTRGPRTRWPSPSPPPSLLHAGP